MNHPKFRQRQQAFDPVHSKRAVRSTQVAPSAQRPAIASKEKAHRFHLPLRSLPIGSRIVDPYLVLSVDRSAQIAQKILRLLANEKVRYIKRPGPCIVRSRSDSTASIPSNAVRAARARSGSAQPRTISASPSIGTPFTIKSRMSL